MGRSWAYQKSLVWRICSPVTKNIFYLTADYKLAIKFLLRSITNLIYCNCIACQSRWLKNFLRKKSKQSLSFSKIVVRYCVIFLLWFFSFHPFSYAQEEVEEDNVIREGPPPLVDPLYLDLGTFVVNMPGDKYFLKSSIQPVSYTHLTLPTILRV